MPRHPDPRPAPVPVRVPAPALAPLSAAALALAVALAGVAIASPAAAIEVPPAPAGRVSDYAGLLSSAAIQRIEAASARHESESSDQVAVAIFPSLDDENLEDFSIRLAERWQIGTGEHDNGVILLIFVKERRTRIEVGYGLEGRLTDARSSRILRQVVAPRFRAGDYDGGVEAAVEAIIGTIKGEYQAEEEKRSRPSPLVGIMGPLLLALGFGLMFLFVPRWFWALLLGEMLVSGRRDWSTRRHRGGFGGFGGFGGGGFGGGGFGGGGGGFGGGGSSGGW